MKEKIFEDRVIKIRSDEITKEQLESGRNFFVPGYCSSISKIEPDQYHMPFPSGPHSLQQTLDFCHSCIGSHVWLTVKDEENIESILNDPLWNNATRLHEKPKLDYCEENEDKKYIFRKFVCECCDSLLGYGGVLYADYNLICSQCMTDCYK